MKAPSRWPDLENAISGAFLVLLIVTLLAQAAARLMGTGIPFTEEFARYQLFTLGFLAMSGAIIGDTHQAIDVLRFFVGAKARQVVRLAVYGLMLLTLAILCWLGMEFLLAQIKSGRRWFTAPFPQYIAYVCYPVGCALGVFRLLEKMTFSVRRWREDV